MSAAATTLTLADAARLMRDPRARFLAGPGGQRTWIYFMQRGENGPIKIGRSGDPQERLRHLQRGNPDRIRIIGAYWGFQLEEAQLHEEFKASRIAGEWFEPTPELVATALALDEWDGPFDG